MNKKDSLLLITGLLILSLPFLGIGWQTISRPAPPATVSAALSTACIYPSPDGRHCAGEVAGLGAIVEADDGRVLVSPWVKWSNFHGWTDDGRYALFDHYDQYGNSQGVLFDTEKWKMTRPGGECAYPGRMSASCRFGFELIDLATGLVLQGTGILYDLREGEQMNIFAHPEKGLVWTAAFSPDKKLIAILGAAEMENGYPQETAVSLYIAHLDGTKIIALPRLTFSTSELGATVLSWTEDGQSVSFNVSSGQIYRYFLTEGRIEWSTAVDESP